MASETEYAGEREALQPGQHAGAYCGPPGYSAGSGPRVPRDLVLPDSGRHHGRWLLDAVFDDEHW